MRERERERERGESENRERGTRGMCGERHWVGTSDE